MLVLLGLVADGQLVLGRVGHALHDLGDPLAVAAPARHWRRPELLLRLLELAADIAGSLVVLELDWVPLALDVLLLGLGFILLGQLAH
eukprot:7297355-Alexandrium_andersonii.AAC.1